MTERTKTIKGLISGQVDMGTFGLVELELLAIENEMEYTKEQIEEMKKKADKWDALGAKIEKCYCNADGEYDEENPEIEDADLCTIGKMAASAFGWL